MRRLLVLVASLGLVLVGCSPHVRGVVVFVGDSNFVLSAASLVDDLSNRDDGYVPVMFATGGTGIRSSDCPGRGSCPTANFWSVRLGEGLPKIDGDAFAVNLGINDATTPGTPTTKGYADYDGKIDWLMGLLPVDRPVFWSNLPCALEPPEWQVGCGVINTALANAPARHPNFTLVDWSTVATPHPEYMKPNDVHYTQAGNDAYAALFAQALDVQIPGPGPTTTVPTTPTT